MKTTLLKIEGMSCQHCVKAVSNELAKLKNVTVHAVAVGEADISYEESPQVSQQIAEAIAAAGYRLKIPL
jgi:copper chaperone